jgi:hypothetical protein
MHARLVNVPPHVPEYTWNTASYKVPGATAISCDVPVATNEYQTSSSAVPAQPAADCVALTVVPDVVDEHVNEGLTVKATAPEQLSLAGGGGGVVTQIVNVPFVPDP